MATVWLLGSGGLLGSAVLRRSSCSSHQLLTDRIDWSELASARASFRSRIEALAATPGPLSIAWCAGAGVVGSTSESFAHEHAIVAALMDELRSGLGDRLSGMPIFVASSAGAVYAGGGPPPHTELSATGALSAYGHAKLALEQSFTDFAAETGAVVVLGRIANLYGPGQNLAKGQGLVSVMMNGALSGDPVSIYVDLDTIRDYIYVDDAADMVLSCLDRALTLSPGSALVKVIASGQRTTIAHLIGITKAVARRPRVVVGRSPLSSASARDLSLRSVVWPEVNSLASTPLLVGVHRTLLDLQQHRMAPTC